jgi:hypothetical protein
MQLEEIPEGKNKKAGGLKSKKAKKHGVRG